MPGGSKIRCHVNWRRKRSLTPEPVLKSFRCHGHCDLADCRFQRFYMCNSHVVRGKLFIGQQVGAQGHLGKPLPFVFILNGNQNQLLIAAFECAVGRHGRMAQADRLGSAFAILGVNKGTAIHSADTSKRGKSKRIPLSRLCRV